MRAAILLFFLASRAQAQSDSVEPMPDVSGMDAATEALADGCRGTDAAACTALADLRLRSGDGTRANALYRRAADLVRATTAPSARATRPRTIRSAADALAALEASWPSVVVPAAAAHGLGDFARSASGQIFGPSAVTTWRTRRARFSDAFRTVHTMRTREGAVFDELAWIGDPHVLADSEDCWELTFGYMLLDFVAYVDDTGTVIAIVHVPEG